LAYEAGRNIGRTSSRIADDNPHRPHRIDLRHCDPRCGRDRSSARRQMKKSTAREFCCFHSEQTAMQQGGLDWTPPRWPGF
jgi:hypothetical protein